MTTPSLLDRESCYRAVKSRDRRFDGTFYTAVRTTGIYCRPSCPARTPAFGNVTFHPTAAAAQAAGYRACKRCLPDATPGSPDWDVAASVAGRAMRLIADGVVDREGVEGLARRVGYTPRHLGRILLAELGAGPLALARARRAQTARVLVDTTDLPFSDVAFAAGFASVRQFNDTVREVYAASPTELRGRRGGRPATGTVTLRLAVRAPFAGRALLAFLAHHLIPGIEVASTGPDGSGSYARTLDLPHGPGTLRLDLDDEPQAGVTAFVPLTLSLTDLRDVSAATERARRLVDGDCDPVAVDEHFAGDPLIGPLVRRTPGLRVSGQVDGDELAVRTVIGQQVSVAGACTVTGRLVATHGRRVETGVPGLTHLFPRAVDLADVDPETLPMPRSRGRALAGLAAALAAGSPALDRGADRDDVRRALLALPGIGPWTADYVALRALGDPDVMLASDVGVRNALVGLGHDPGTVLAAAERWRPWRSYALLHLWDTLMPRPDSIHPDSIHPAPIRREA
ncbi:helix-turn-helix domain-containing protein [Nocardioides sp. dk4132]|uniref:Ada metal-binding domain-containing protein n=1 Tax=unclassified Nocardioides TaxID=2615069 RepID=UPI001296F2D2|nr:MULTISPECIES: Ada metal-binding domain-containing protein [unclassified Nocardioides]MQW77729.1 helix-turn-helix domain-containing protein [Nocardioides sp. dk4132]QGA07080.1 helix-turn-helix domain-containing protein [Nocardioides sp. dk884]